MCFRRTCFVYTLTLAERNNSLSLVINGYKSLSITVARKPRIDGDGVKKPQNACLDLQGQEKGEGMKEREMKRKKKKKKTPSILPEIHGSSSRKTESKKMNYRTQFWKPSDRWRTGINCV